MKQLILLLTVAVLVGHSQAQSNRKCAANGEYCLTHSECCSGSCLSFSYKCVPVPPGPSIGTTFVPVTVDTANRFGGPDDGGASITQKTCARNGEYCQLHSECCSGSCLSFSYKCVPIPGQAPQPGETEPHRPTPAPSTTVDLGNRVGEDGGGSSSTVPVSHSTPRPQKCAGIGEYCLLSSECCSGSCLSFSYKCVTNPQLSTGQNSRPPPPPATDLSNRFDGSSSSSGSSSPPKKCAAVGEYCLTSSECCSLSCLSFSYKCVTNHNLGTQIQTQSGFPVQVPSTNTGSVIDTANRFGGESSSKCTANGQYCFHSGECCSGACFKSFCATEIKLGVREEDLIRPSPVNGPYVQVNNLDDLITRFGGGSDSGSTQPGRAIDSSGSASSKRGNVLVAQRADTGKQCAVVGETCSKQEDCCSQRCHSYRRKCVT